MYLYTGCPKNMTEFRIEITPEIFDPENQLGYFWEAGTSSYFTG